MELAELQATGRKQRDAKQPAINESARALLALLDERESLCLRSQIIGSDDWQRLQYQIREMIRKTEVTP
ncbi:hypothetical protein GC175_04930 [bacterium]|nr:hypothetical protein [bacterium]